MLIKHKIRIWGLFCLFLSSMCSVSGCKEKQPVSPTPPVKPAEPTWVKTQVQFWLTNPDLSTLFKRQNVALNFSTSSNTNAAPVIEVDTAQTYQTIDGFGYTLTGGSAIVINQLNATKKADLLKELFAVDSTYIGISYLRISVGASDLSDRVYTYDDTPAGQTDVNLTNFNLAQDQTQLIPLLKEILKINPSIKILATPWTAPVWMKTNNNFIGGSLKSEYYEVYARYLIKYLQAMQAEGIIIDAITVQNEPLHDGNNPSMYMPANEQAAFIKNYFGPALQSSGLKTKIILYDHNADMPDYPISILNDPEAKKYVDGSAFHLYGGSISALSTVRNAHPDKNIYFTEQYTAASGSFAEDLNWHLKNLIIGATRNWSRNVLEWNLAADPNNRPYTNGGCTVCLPAVTVSGSSISHNVSYYIIAHAAKFVRPGSVRIATNIPVNLQNVAFKRPDGKKVLIVLNDSQTSQTFNIKYRGSMIATTLNGGAVGTYFW